jgi:hypothetical protein
MRIRIGRADLRGIEALDQRVLFAAAARDGTLAPLATLNPLVRGTGGGTTSLSQGLLAKRIQDFIEAFRGLQTREYTEEMNVRIRTSA